MTLVHLVALGTGEHHQRYLSSLCGPWATTWFPASSQAQPYRKLYGRSPAARCRDGLHPVENAATASCRSRSGEGEVMPSPSARAANQRSSASAAGTGVDGELGGRWQAVASGGGSAPNLTPLVGRGAGGERTVARVGSPFRCQRGFVGRMGVLPWHRRSSYEPDAPARGVPQSPRWRVGLVCAKDVKLSCRGNKTPRNGLEKAIFGGICYVAHNSATAV